MKRTLSQSWWLLLAVMVQSAIGASMVPLRYLQTIGGLPGLAVIGLTDLVALSIMSWGVIPKIDKRFWRSKTLWVMVGIVILRTLMLTFATRFTKAYIVQLVNMLAPFVVVLMNRVFIRKPLPRFTILAITISLVGSVLMIFGGLINDPLAFLLTAEDALGILFAFGATFLIAGYMMIVKRGDDIGLPFEIVYFSQISSLTVVMLAISLGSGEDWTAFSQIDWRVVVAFLSIAIGMEIVCKMGNILTLRKLGAPLVSSLLAMRLVAALFFGWIVLGEKLTSGLQWAGMLLVVFAVTGFLLIQGRDQPPLVAEQIN